MTVSIGLWSVALRCSSRWFSDRELSALAVGASLATVEPTMQSLQPRVGALLRLTAGRRALFEAINLAESAALLARGIVHRRFSTRLDTDFLRDGLTREISVIALTAAVSAWLLARQEYPRSWMRTCRGSRVSATSWPKR
jgi:hypothetical protein